MPFLATPGIELLYSGVEKIRAVGCGDGVLQRGRGRRDSGRGFVVGVVDGDAVQRANVEHGTRGHEVGCGAQQRRIEGLAPQASGQADQSDHRVSRLDRRECLILVKSSPVKSAQRHRDT
jgi:hypothetical protein